jgi:predicted nucleic acid-binding protein
VTRYLLDTSIVSELRKAKPHAAVVAWTKTLRPEQIFLSAVTLGELQAGVELTRKNDPAKALEIENWLTTVESSYATLPMDSACFREWARLMAGKSATLIEDAMRRRLGCTGCRWPRETRKISDSSNSQRSTPFNFSRVCCVSNAKISIAFRQNRKIGRT